MARIKYLLLLLLACSSVAALAQETATVSFNQQATPYVVLYPSFSGLSFEKSGINKAQTTSWGDTAVQKVFEQLGHSVMRVGGNSTDQALWAGSYTSATLCPTGGTYTCSYSAGVCKTLTGPNIPQGGETGGPGCAYVTTQNALNALNTFLNATGWKVIWSLNMCLNPNDGRNNCDSSNSGIYTEPPIGTIDTYAGYAAAEALAVATTLGSNLVGFELGNEPGSWANNGVRWKGPVATTPDSTCNDSPASVSVLLADPSATSSPLATPVNTTGSSSSMSATVMVASGTGIVPGMPVIGSYIPSGTIVQAISGTTVTLSKNNTDSNSFTSEPLTFNPYVITNPGCGCSSSTMNLNGGGTGGVVACTVNASGSVTSCTVNEVGSGYYPSYNTLQVSTGQGNVSNSYANGDYFTEFNEFAKTINAAFSSNHMSAPNLIGPADENAYFDSTTTPNYFTTGNDVVSPASQSSMITDHLYPGGNQELEDASQLTSLLEFTSTSLEFILNPINANISNGIPFRTGEASTFSGENYSGIELMTPVNAGLNYHVGDTITVPANSPPACYTGTAYSAAQATVTSVAPSTGAVTGLQVIANENGWGFNTGYPGRNTDFPGTGVATTGGHGNGDLTVNYTTGNAGNEYGTALFGLDFEFAHVQSVGSGHNYAAGVNYHDVWAPIPTDIDGAGTLGDGVAGDPYVRPLFYSMYLISQGLGVSWLNTSSLPANFEAYTTVATTSVNYYHVLLNNKDFTKSVSTTVTFPSTVTEAYSLLMTSTPSSVSTTGTASSGSTSLVVASAVGIDVNMTVAGINIAPGTYITAISGTTLTLSKETAGTLDATAVTFGFPIRNTADITIGGSSINSSGEWTPCTPTGISTCGAVNLNADGVDTVTVVVPPGSTMLVTGKSN